MAISEQWLPVIAEGISWVKDKLGPSKKELKICVSDLKKQMQALAYGNSLLSENLSLIIQAVINQLQSEGNYIINADSIVFIGNNDGYIDLTAPKITRYSLTHDATFDEKANENEVSKIFDGIEEEIAHSRATRPSDRR